MKRIFAAFLMFAMLIAGIGCQKEPQVKPEISQMKAICELAVMQCHYHNVAKYVDQNDTEGALWWKKYTKFWIEYDGIVTLGIDASLVSLEIDKDQITVTLPPAKVLECDINDNKLNENSYIVAKNSAEPSADDEIAAFAQAQDDMRKKAESNTELLAMAQQRAKTLLEEYITNIGNAVGKQYTINWIYLDTEKNPAESTFDETAPAT